MEGSCAAGSSVPLQCVGGGAPTAGLAVALVSNCNCTPRKIVFPPGVVCACGLRSHVPSDSPSVLVAACLCLWFGFLSFLLAVCWWCARAVVASLRCRCACASLQCLMLAHAQHDCVSIGLFQGTGFAATGHCRCTRRFEAAPGFPDTPACCCWAGLAPARQPVSGAAVAACDSSLCTLGCVKRVTQAKKTQADRRRYSRIMIRCRDAGSMTYSALWLLSTFHLKDCRVLSATHT